MLSTVEICGFHAALLNRRTDNDSQHILILFVSYARVNPGLKQRDIGDGPGLADSGQGRDNVLGRSF